MKIIYEILKKYKGYIVCIIIILMASLSIFIQEKDKYTKSDDNSQIAVYVTGEVNSPGVYYLKKGARMFELLDACNGVSNEADIDKINMAQLLNDSDKIVILKKVINEEKKEEVYGEKNNKININIADKEELMSLSGIGESTAEKIIEYRKNNVFNNIEDIMEIKSIGQNKFNSIKDSITVY